MRRKASGRDLRLSIRMARALLPKIVEDGPHGDVHARRIAKLVE